MGKKDRTKDQEMAARMKANGEERRKGRCPICNRMVHASGRNGLADMTAHLSVCKG